MAHAGEFDLIARFVAAFRPARAPRGPGDDCAVLPPARGELCVTTDAVLEGVHFTLETSSLEDVGHKALAVNLSDLAAMGARPTWFVCALGLPRGTGAREVTALARGMAPLAKAHGAELAGGNVTRAAQLTLTLTAAGEVPRGGALLRSGGRAGDELYVSGVLGDARLGLAKLAARKSPSAGAGRKSSLSPFFAQRRPEPKVALGLLARSHASAAIDVSDGLGQDLGHLCAASGVGAEVDVAALPVSPALRAHAGARAWEWALAGGEDYQLLLAVPPRRAAAFERQAARAGEKVTRVGRLTAGRAPRFLLEGADVRAPRGFDHFR